MPDILVVDDEQEIADLVELYLKNEGYTLYKCYDGAQALEQIAARPFDLAILDVMLPETSGFDLCRKIREAYTYPVIMLTARTEDMDKITGLTIGADDYVTKPFNPLELVARVKAQLRRSTRYNAGAAPESHVIDFSGLEITRIRTSAGSTTSRSTSPRRSFPCCGCCARTGGRCYPRRSSLKASGGRSTWTPTTP